jgi:hypothetical protein
MWKSLENAIKAISLMPEFNFINRWFGFFRIVVGWDSEEIRKDKVGKLKKLLEEKCRLYRNKSGTTDSTAQQNISQISLKPFLTWKFLFIE